MAGQGRGVHLDAGVSSAEGLPRRRLWQRAASQVLGSRFSLSLAPSLKLCSEARPSWVSHPVTAAFPWWRGVWAEREPLGLAQAWWREVQVTGPGF